MECRQSQKSEKCIHWYRKELALLLVVCALLLIVHILLLIVRALLLFDNYNMNNNTICIINIIVLLKIIAD